MRAYVSHSSANASDGAVQVTVSRTGVGAGVGSGVADRLGSGVADCSAVGAPPPATAAPATNATAPNRMMTARRMAALAIGGREVVRLVMDRVLPVSGGRWDADSPPKADSVLVTPQPR